MTNTIELEIVKLVQEIGKLEVELEDAKHSARTFKTQIFKEQYEAEAKSLEARLERRMHLLKILKG